MKRKHMLVIDDEAAQRLMVRAVLEDAGWAVWEAPSAEKALALLKGGAAKDVRVILLDVRLPGMTGHELLDALRKKYPQIPVVMLTAYGTVGSAVEAMKRGAFDYLTKPADNDELVTVAEKALEQSALLRENKELRTRVEGVDPLAPLKGGSPAMRALRDFIRQAGPSEGTVLILGESGTGKELIADALHACSPRAAHPLVKVNCAALPGHLLESELFGYHKGAFTGAAKDKPGRFQLADGGTLFLDEVGELPLDLQAKLLRALQERVVEPLGSIRPVPVDVRILAATNKSLREAVSQGRFREDLFFRLNVLEVVAPPLRERPEDLPALVATLLERVSRRNRKEIRGVSPDFLAALARYAWPGNGREVENVLERAVILGRSDVLDAGALPPHLNASKGGAARHAATENIVSPQIPSAPAAAATEAPGQPPALPKATPFLSESGSVGHLLEEAERQALIQALETHQGHREHTAQALGMSRRTLQYKLKKYGLTKR